MYKYKYILKRIHTNDYSSSLLLNLSGMIRDFTEEVEGRKMSRMGRGENSCAWINMNNDFMLNFCKILMICCYSIKPICCRDCWAGNVIATSKLVIMSAIHQMLPVLCLPGMW